jgi:hypothetical protein
VDSETDKEHKMRITNAVASSGRIKEAACGRRGPEKEWISHRLKLNLEDETGDFSD